MESSKFFVSYARKDSEFVLKLAKELRNFGASLWLDQLDILGGQRWDEAVQGALESCQGMLVVLSPHAVVSQNLKDEYSFALDEGKQIIPVLYQECAIPFRLRRVQYVDFIADYSKGFTQLLKALRLGQPSLPAAVPEINIPEEKALRLGQPTLSAAASQIILPEESGKYLLFKKLDEDPLGETFRAGRLGQRGIDQVVLLRVFNGKGLAGEKQWGRASGWVSVQEILKSPNIGNDIDLGRIRNFPCAVYDYISGKSLAAVFAQSARQRSPVPIDLSLFIAERISLTLAEASESRLQNERAVHGFVVPQLVMISNEGETRLLGFEVASGLRELAAAGWKDEGLRPYLAPEARAGAAPSRADDVYSLGALLFELLTGERPPVMSATGHHILIGNTTLPYRLTPLPASVVALLNKSLAAREHRIASALIWHERISELMIDGHFSPTTFNLGFFMHFHFRDDIERENKELQAEKKLKLPR